MILKIVTISVNLGSFILAIWLSTRKENKKIIYIAWGFAGVISLGNIFLWMTKPPLPTPIYGDLIAPNVRSLDAFKMVKDSFGDEIIDYELIDVIGSYYICLNKPDTIFYCFPEWVFLFRHQSKDKFLEFKVSDNRIPAMPHLDLHEIEEGQIAYYIVPREMVISSGIRIGPNNPINIMIHIMDEGGRSLVIISGKGPKDNIDEVTNGINSQVLARAQIAGRPSEEANTYLSIESLQKRGKLYIRKAEFIGNNFYRELKPITNWKIGAEDAVRIAVKAGAKGIPLGKTSGPGVFRLNHASWNNLDRACWDIPHRIDGIRPVLVDASLGRLYAVNNKGAYSTKWEKHFSITSE